MMEEAGKEYPVVYIITRNHDAFSLTSQCIQSLRQLTYPNYRILVVDDGSKDDSADKISKKFSEVQLIRTGRYLEYCKGLNVGIGVALKNGAEYVFLVNNDTKDFSPNYLEEIVQAFEEDSKVGLVGSWCYDYDGRVRWNGIAKDMIGTLMETPTEGFIVKREVFEKIGLLDEKLVRHFEDLDFIIRIRKSGYTTKAVSSVSFAHLGGGTSLKHPFIPNYYRVRNLIWFMKRYCTDKPLRWKMRKFMAGLEPHVIRLVNSLKQLEIKRFVIIGCSITCGFIAGITTRWRGNE